MLFPIPRLTLVLAVIASCATASAPTPSEAPLRLPGLPWGLTTPEVTAALVERGFRFAGRNAAGDLRFSRGELLGHDAALVARMHGDRLVKIVAILEPRDPDRPDREIDAILRRLRPFYGLPSTDVPSGGGSPGSSSASDREATGWAWVRRRPDGLRYGALLRVTPGPAYRLDLESPLWPDVHAARGTAGERDGLAALET